jgi:hypothetical protein
MLLLQVQIDERGKNALMAEQLFDDEEIGAGF